MIITEPKPLETLLDMLKSVDARRVFLVGCGECATVVGTGGKREVAQAASVLAEHGFEVTGSEISDVTCNVGGTKLELRKHKDDLRGADAVIVYACGSGVQTVAEALDIPVFPALDSKFLGNVIRHGEFEERCQTCGDCVLGQTAGICPVTQCPKGLLNGPCGGMWDGMCEVVPDHKCTHVRIIEKLKTQSRLEEVPLAPKNFGANVKPGRVSHRAERPPRASRKNASANATQVAD